MVVPLCSRNVVMSKCIRQAMLAWFVFCSVKFSLRLSLICKKTGVQYRYFIEACEFSAAQFVYSTDILLRPVSFQLRSLSTVSLNF
jgi:hypothetical protein